MTLVHWLMRLGTTQAASNAAAVLDARRRAEANVDAVAQNVAQRVSSAA